MTRIKICCIASQEEARMAIEAGASLLGLVSAMPSGPGPISDEAIAGIAETVPPGVESVLLTARTAAPAIAAQAHAAGVSAVQLVDHVSAEDHAALRAALPNLRIIQVIHVVDDSAVDEAVLAARTADAVLLDSGNPRAAVRELGGTGRVHRWEISEEIVRRLDRPVYLAGGLTPDNAGEAVRRVRPFGLDICSGLRSDGRLDPERLARFVTAVRAAEARLDLGAPA